MGVTYSQHLLVRLQERNIPSDYPRRILFRPTNKFYDTLRNSYVALRQLPYGGRQLWIMIAYRYDRKSKCVTIQTIHPESLQEVQNRIRKGRYKVL